MPSARMPPPNCGFGEWQEEREAILKELGL